MEKCRYCRRAANALVLAVLASLVGAATQSESFDYSGSGFALPHTRYVVTNYHVVKGGTDLVVRTAGQHDYSNVRVVLKDVSNDLVVLEVADRAYVRDFPSTSPFVIPAVGSTKVGQEVFTLGFPLSDVMGTTAPRLSTGTVSSLYGIRDDPRVIQISNPIQPGNSGGPLLNRFGELVGVVVSGLNAQAFLEADGTIPQNVNFAIKVNYLRALLQLLPSKVPVGAGTPATRTSSLEEQVARVAPFVVFIGVHVGEDGRGESSSPSAAPTPPLRPTPPPSAPARPPSPVPPTPAPRAPTTAVDLLTEVVMLQGESVYHWPGCPRVKDRRNQLTFHLEQVVNWAWPCTVCRPPSRSDNGEPPPPRWPMRGPEPSRNEVVMVQGERIYHKWPCPLLVGKNNLLVFSVGQVARWAIPCSVCRPPTR